MKGPQRYTGLESEEDIAESILYREGRRDLPLRDSPGVYNALDVDEAKTAALDARYQVFKRGKVANPKRVSNASMAKDVRKLLKQAERAGCEIKHGAKHYKVYCPGDVPMVTVSKTPSDPAALRYIQRDLERAGVPFSNPWIGGVEETPEYIMPGLWRYKGHSIEVESKGAGKVGPPYAYYIKPDVEWTRGADYVARNEYPDEQMALRDAVWAIDLDVEYDNAGENRENHIKMYNMLDWAGSMSHARNEPIDRSSIARAIEQVREYNDISLQIAVADPKDREEIAKLKKLLPKPPWGQSGMAKAWRTTADYYYSLPLEDRLDAADKIIEHYRNIGRVSNPGSLARDIKTARQRKARKGAGKATGQGKVAKELGQKRVSKALKALSNPATFGAPVTTNTISKIRNEFPKILKNARKPGSKRKNPSNRSAAYKIGKQWSEGFLKNKGNPKDLLKKPKDYAKVALAESYANTGKWPSGRLEVQEAAMGIKEVANPRAFSLESQVKMGRQSKAKKSAKRATKARGVAKGVKKKRVKKALKKL